METRLHNTGTYWEPKKTQQTFIGIRSTILHCKIKGMILELKSTLNENVGNKKLWLKLHVSNQKSYE